MGVPNVNIARCLFCGACVRSCPTGAMERPGIVDLMRCAECGSCAEACVTHALVMEEYALVDDDSCYELSVCALER